MEVLAVSTKLGFTSFGGPVAHLGYFHNEYIKRRQWMDDRSYADLVALCQFLPGPASSQVGIGIGVMRAGLLGGIAAWIGFTLPSLIALVLFAYLLHGFDIAQAGWIHGLKLVAVAIVAQAVLSMGQKLASGRSRATIAILAMAVALLWPTAWSQIIIMILSAIAGMMLYKANDSELPAIRVPVRRSTATGSLILFVVLLILLPVLASSGSSHWLSVFDSFYRSGSLVFGGGHVVLPLLEREIVPAGWLSKGEFLAGYGAAQAVPGPLFTFAAYLGALMGGWFGAVVATLSIFLPAFLLVVGALPFWDMLRKRPGIQGALAGVNAAVVGILIAALYSPIWTSTILDGTDFAMAAILFACLAFWKAPPWLVVIIGALGGWLVSLFQAV
ncbi:chromate transporter [Paenibacillus pinihumi]|uniref:chromate transporter n=1 Tax=Paenibacillus pinihumi TaxID=669462 RepID=UPI00068794D7|nr:chromate transporter [Paenibacillus pinihumi]